MPKKPQPSPEALALVLSLAARRFPSNCLVCRQVVKDIQPRGTEFVRLPCGHRVEL